ncbi:hypothetical protein BD324DRAFT_194482 [Kockovaella imperatae]|uniref:Tetraspanin n=1 Tax=Kockovaella imperatae TaxID=4999 RepID=A0A1Y1U7P6_9TREE|nr:hypothetical protein BD324DRAFT_194482 [Kockovaella imperatae]ORX34059.1 hypothetical protein BD324DRAFT_194482 [Kockovaella imperatae]
MKKLVSVWAALDFCLLVAGILIITMSFLLSIGDDVVLKLFFREFDQKLGIALGSTYIFAFVFSIPAIIQSAERGKLLKIQSWLLLSIAVFTLTAGTIVWQFSLGQLNNFSILWAKEDIIVQQAIQDEFSCCGYWNGTTAGLFTATGGHCIDTAFAATQPGCQASITSSSPPGSDYVLNQLFTSIYGFEAIIGGLFLATLCIINERRLQVRFAMIDSKRGGSGFV